MHLLAGDIGRIDDGDSAVDLDQSPGDIVVLSSADSELSALTAAVKRRGEGPTLRLANLMRLAHPLSVDLYIDKTLAAARLVVVRMMGGAGYWSYGLDRLRALARAGGPRLAVIPGEDRWDPALEPYSTVPIEGARLLWRYFAEADPANIDRALAQMAHLIDRGQEPQPPEPLARAGFYLPRSGPVDANAMKARLDPSLPVAFIAFYRAILQGGSTAPIDALVAALEGQGLSAVAVYVASLKDRESEVFLDQAFSHFSPAIVLNATAFAVSRIGTSHAGTVLDRPGRPVLQIVLAGSSEESWRANARGLGPKDLVMNVVLPEVDGRLLTRAVSFKEEVRDPLSDSRTATYRPAADRIAFVAKQAAAWVRLANKPAKDRRVAIVLSNYPNRDGRIANGVGLDTPESAVRLAEAMSEAGYDLSAFPATGAALMAFLLAMPLPQTVVPAETKRRAGTPRGVGRTDTGFHESHSSRGPGSRFASPGRQGVSLPLATYNVFLATLSASARTALNARWGDPECDPLFHAGAFHLPIHRFGNVVVAIQPARGYAVDPKATYHDPDLVPPHHYLAFYAWLREDFSADAVVQLGKHGNLEWLPGKALGLSAECWPEIALGPLPLIYPFIVNDPGEGSQAKRRSSAVIVDHLMPAMTRAEIHGGLAELETLIDEYYLAAGVDERRRAFLEKEIIATAERTGLDRDLSIVRKDTGNVLRALDAHLCELKEMQIRDGLHVLGASPEGRQRIDTLVAIARTPRSGNRPADSSLHRAIAADLALAIDPLDCDLAGEWTGPRPAALATISDAPWRTNGDTVERIELLAATLTTTVIPAEAKRRAGTPRRMWQDSPVSLLSGSRVEASPRPGRQGGAADIRHQHHERPATNVVLDWIARTLAPSLDTSGKAEIASILTALDGRFVPPGPSGAPTRGRPDVLPTGRNFYSVDIRAVPTAAAWELGRKAAEAVALRYFQDEGEWPRSMALSAWGTSNMRTGGDDIAEVLAFIGAKPVWEPGTGRVTGFTIISLSDLRRPRIDVTLKISGMFRDAFPEQLDLIDSAMRAVAALDEDETANPLAAAARETRERLTANGIAPAVAERLATTRIFGAKPGAYGAGLQTTIDEGIWETRADLAEAFLAWGAFAYGGGQQGDAARAHFTERLATTDAVLHNQDNQEHDILDSDDYYQFQGGLSAAVEALKGVAPRTYHMHSARPEKPVVRSLSEEIARVVRGRAANPKWIGGMMRHGYKGAFEIAATVDYLFAYAATTNAVGDHHFDQLYDAYIADDSVRLFIETANPSALAEMAARFREAIDRALWSPRLNSAYDRLSALVAERKDAAE